MKQYHDFLHESVHELQPEQCRIDSKVIESRLKVGRRRDAFQVLLGTKLIFKRSFDIGMDQELHARRVAVAGGSQGSEECRTAGKRETVDPVGAGVYSIPAHDEHYPR